MFATPNTLADRVLHRLRQLDRRSVHRETLATVFAVMFYASLRTEEGVPTRFAIAYLDGSNPDPSPPEFPPADRWSYTRLADPLPFDVSTVVKLAPATDPRGSSLAIFAGAHGPMIWGLIDQQNRFHDFVNYDANIGPERPGLFQAHVVGQGHIVAFVDYSKIGELRIDEFQRQSIDVMGHGAIRRLLDPGIRLHLEAVRSQLEPELWSQLSELRPSLRRTWINSLSRILIRAQNYRRGGAVLISDDPDTVDLDVKYPLGYSRLRSSAERRGVELAQNVAAFNAITKLLDSDEETIPSSDHLDFVVTENNLSSIDNEIDGATRFLSLLTRVDGLLLLRPNLDAVGFGAMITAEGSPMRLEIARTASGSAKMTVPASYDRHGSRHRSMIRYCARHPGSVGFVISQDGDVRAVTRLEDRVVIWEHVRLQLETDFWREAHRKRVVVEARDDAAAPLPTDEGN
jgi:hypothetical protein